MDPFADEIVFDAPAPKVDFPDDDLNAPLVSIETIFYLTISTPHTDTWEWQGPFASFDKIISLLRMHFPVASAKLDQLSKTKKTSGNGFTTLVVPDDNDTSRFRVFKVITEPNPAVRSLLPAPVFTVTRAGPLTHDIDAFTGKVLSSATKGRYTTSHITASFPDRHSARAAAEAAMRDMLAAEPNAPTPTRSFPARDAGGGLIMAMNYRARWEVRVFFEMERVERERDGELV